jgi:hypothetical protein
MAVLEQATDTLHHLRSSAVEECYVTNRHDCRFLKHKTGIVCNKEFKCDGYVTTTKELVRHHHIQGRSGYFPQI